MKKAIRNFLIEAICYVVIMGIFLVVFGFIHGWDADRVISEIIGFTLGWVAILLVKKLLEIRDKKMEKEKARAEKENAKNKKKR